MATGATGRMKTFGKLFCSGCQVLPKSFCSRCKVFRDSFCSRLLLFMYPTLFSDFRNTRGDTKNDDFCSRFWLFFLWQDAPVEIEHVRIRVTTKWVKKK